MKKLLCMIVLVIALNLSAQNHMDLITSMVGEHNDSIMGESLASLDFNGDGYDDLIVSSPGWRFQQQPGSIIYGKIYFYWGGPDFDNIPDFVLEGTYRSQFSAQLTNLGDVNGDGIEDLGMSHYGPPNGIDSGNPTFSIFFGRQTPSIIPDFSCNYVYTQYHLLVQCPLGDINGDGFDDVGLRLNYISTNRFQIVYGGSLEVVTLFDAGVTSYEANFTNVGDVNNDGYADFSIGYAANNMKQVTLYYGGPEFDLDNNLLLFQQTYGIFDGSFAVGDVNGDSYDDFIGYEIDYSCRLWYGQDNITTAWDVVLTPAMIGYNASGVVYGDVNNDGYSDIIGSQPGYSGDNGRAGLWLGGQEFNGIVDLYIYPPENPTRSHFGLSGAMGDFNGDGFDDYAASAPYRTNTTAFTGIVYVYAGNAELADTTVGNEDQTDTEPISYLNLLVYPNPVKTDATIRFTTAKAGLVRLEVCNLKGQLVRELCNSSYNKGQHNIVWDGKDNQGKAVSSGVYLCRLEAGKEILQKKMILMK